MLLFRSLTVGLLAACAYLVADLPAVHTHTVRTVQVTQPPVVHRTNMVTVVDVARSVAPVNIHSLLWLKPGEAVTAINDRVIVPLDVVSEIVDAVSSAGAQYLDLTVEGNREQRRILVLLH